jgi:hypothetical protein
VLPFQWPLCLTILLHSVNQAFALMPGTHTRAGDETDGDDDYEAEARKRRKVRRPSFGMMPSASDAPEVSRGIQATLTKDVTVLAVVPSLCHSRGGRSESYRMHWADAWQGHQQCHISFRNCSSASVGHTYIHTSLSWSVPGGAHRRSPLTSRSTGGGCQSGSPKSR